MCVYVDVLCTCVRVYKCTYVYVQFPTVIHLPLTFCCFVFVCVFSSPLLSSPIFTSPHLTSPLLSSSSILFHSFFRILWCNVLIWCLDSQDKVQDPCMCADRQIIRLKIRKTYSERKETKERIVETGEKKKKERKKRLFKTHRMVRWNRVRWGEGWRSTC